MSEWPAKSVSMQKTESLSPYDRNSRVHSERQIDQIVNSIREFGFTIPVLVDEKSMLIAGHGRVMAAQKMGLEEIPVMVATKWTDQQKRAYVIADNKLTENSTWDEELLKSEIKQLEFEEYNLDFLGFDVDELTNLFLDKEFGKTDALEEWTDMPEYEGLDPCYKKVVVNFDDEESFNKFFEVVGQDHTEKTKSIWFPEKEKRNLKDLEWADEG
jgi:hypothetical protein